MAHALGNPFDIAAALLCESNLWLIEDNCDALVVVIQCLVIC